MSTKKEVTTVQENTKESSKVENAQPTQPTQPVQPNQPADPSQPSQPADPGNSGSTPGLSFDTSDRVTGDTNW